MYVSSFISSKKETENHFFTVEYYLFKMHTYNEFTRFNLDSYMLKNILFSYRRINLYEVARAASGLKIINYKKDAKSAKFPKFIDIKMYVGLFLT